MRFWYKALICIKCFVECQEDVIDLATHMAVIQRGFRIGSCASVDRKVSGQCVAAAWLRQLTPDKAHATLGSGSLLPAHR